MTRARLKVRHRYELARQYDPRDRDDTECQHEPVEGRRAASAKWVLNTTVHRDLSEKKAGAQLRSEGG